MASKERYAELADNIVDLLGGKDNISFFTHCVSRLRFNVKDKGLVNKDAIEKLPGAVGSQWSGDQYQVIIGTDVADAYRAVCKVSGLGEIQGDAAQPSGEKLSIKGVFNSIFDAISGSLAPTLPILIAGGMLKIAVMVFGMLGMPATTGGYQIFSFIADSAFYFLPVYIGAFAAKKFGANMALGMLVGAMLLHPNFIAMTNAGEPIDLFGLPVYLTTYSSTVFPAILSVFVMSHVERFIDRHCPVIFKGIVVPLLTFVVMVPITLCALAPLGAIVGHYLSVVVLWLYDTMGFVGVSLFTAALPFIIITGMHFGFFPYFLNAFATVGYEPFYCIANFIFNISAGAASLAVGLRAKDKGAKSMFFSAAFTAIVAGVSEPALFGVLFRYKKALWCTSLGGLIGGAIAGIFGATCYTMTSFGLIGLPAFLSADLSNLTFAVLSIAVGCVATFVTTFIAFKDGVPLDAQ